MDKKKKSIFLLTFLSMLLTVFITTPVFAHDAEYGMWHGEEDALVLGTVEKLDGSLCTISVGKALPCINDGNTIYRMLPLNVIPSKMVVDMLGYDSYSISYNGKTKIEIGDIIIVSVDKSRETWKAIYSPYEVSSLNSETLEFLPDNKKTHMAAAWEAFVHSDGKINDFAFSRENVVGKIKDKNGNVKKEVIFEKKHTTDSSTQNSMQDKKTESAVDTKAVESDTAHVQTYNYLWVMPFTIVILILVMVIHKYIKRG